MTRQIWQFGDNLYWAMQSAVKTESHGFTDQPGWNDGDGAIDLVENDSLSFHVLWFESGAPLDSRSTLRIKYHAREFTLELTECTHASLSGVLQLDDQSRSELQKLRSDETEWYLDDDGERLKPQELFESSPWAVINETVDTKILCRYSDMKSGEIQFNTSDGYGGELFDWVRNQS